MSNNNKSILIVEDNATNLRVLTEMLDGNGFNFLIAQDGPRGVKIAKKRIPDIVLLDINLPGMNGYDVCRNLKKDDNTKNIPIIFISALSQAESKAEAYNAGGIDYLTKPIQRDLIIESIRRQLN